VDEFDSNSQLVYNGLEFHFLQVVTYQGAGGPESKPALKLDGAQFEIYGYQSFRRHKEHPFRRLELIPNGGRIVVIVGQWYEDAGVNQQGGAALGATNTAINELDSGPIAIAAAEVVPIIGQNPARIRGVSVQNVGVTAIMVSKTGGALAQAGVILAPGAAANDGNGGTVVFDGWLGGLFAANVAGGPGSVLVSAF
jgi:hypothetical protein